MPQAQGLDPEKVLRRARSPGSTVRKRKNVKKADSGEGCNPFGRTIKSFSINSLNEWGPASGKTVRSSDTAAQ